MEKNIPKKYMMILQRRYGGQTAVEFFSDGEICLTPIVSHKDTKLEQIPKKDCKVKKNTLAFYDSITTKFKNFDELLRNLVPNIYSHDYKKETSFLGFMKNDYMHKLPFVFQDPILEEIASNACGNQININNKTTMDIVLDIVDMIENKESDFVSGINLEINKNENGYHIDRNVVDSMQLLRRMLELKENRDKCGYVLDKSLEEDLSSVKEDILNKIKSYKTFRELYRFRKVYLLKKATKEDIESIRQATPSKNEDENATYRNCYEETRQKSYSKNVEKNNEIEGQMTLFK